MIGFRKDYIRRLFHIRCSPLTKAVSAVSINQASSRKEISYITFRTAARISHHLEMADSESDTKDGCRNSPYFDQSLYDNWYNHSSFNSTQNLESYVCAYTQFLAYDKRIQYAQLSFELISSLLGIVSAILTLLILRHEDFKSVSYFYFRLIAVLDLFSAFHLILFAFSTIFPDYYAKSYGWLWFMTCIGYNTAAVFPNAVDLLTIYLSIERSVACLAPTKFKYINTKRVAYCVSTFSFAMALMLAIPSFFARTVLVTSSGTLSPVPTDFGKTQFYQAFLYFMTLFYIGTGVAAVITSVFVIIGMIKSWRSK